MESGRKIGIDQRAERAGDAAIRSQDRILLRDVTAVGEHGVHGGIVKCRGARDVGGRRRRRIGIDFALTLVELLVDRKTAETIQLRLEYNPSPTFNAGSPDTAPPEVLAYIKERIAPGQPRRAEANARAAARLSESA
jgi:hypothetical protein